MKAVLPAVILATHLLAACHVDSGPGVTYEGKQYEFLCDIDVPHSRLGEALNVETDLPYEVEARRILGVPSGQALAVRMIDGYNCDKKTTWFVAAVPGLSNRRLQQINNLLRAG